MPAAIPLIVLGAAQAAFGAGIIAQLAGLAATIAVGSFEAKKARRRATASQRDLQVTLQSAVEARRTVYGRAKLSGPLVYAVSSGNNHIFLYRVVVLTGHPIDAFEAVYYNDDNLPLGTALPATADFSQVVTSGRYVKEGTPQAHIYGHIGATNQAADATLISASAGQWTADHRLQGCAYLVAQTNYEPAVYTDGLPNVQALIRGKKLYDPRSAVTAWSDNPALVIRDYLTSALAVPAERIDEASFIAAANLCDEYVTFDISTTGSQQAAWAAYMATAQIAGTWELVSGTTYRQRRYRFNGTVTADAAPGEVLEQMVLACAGWLSYTGGVWRLVAGGYTAPTLTLTASDLRGAVNFRARPPRRDLYNVARGAYAGPASNYVATDFQPVVSAAFIAADGGTQMPLEVDLPFTNEPVAAQRLASIFLQRSRQGVLQFPATLTALALRPGDTVAITLPHFGFNGEVFRVEGWSLSDDFGVDLVLREDAASIYTWTPGAAIRDPSPQLNLPNPWVVPVVAGLAAVSGRSTTLVQPDGTMVSRVLVSWNVTDNAFARVVELEAREVGAGAWTPQAIVDDSAGQAYITSLRAGQPYEIRARRRNTIGVLGAWTSINHTPAGVQQDVNLLQNSDWTQDLGYGSGTYTDARALRHWQPFGIGTLAIGRNFGDGLYWNVGRGGMYFYQSGATPGWYQFIYQRVPVSAGTAYEASVYANPHRCGAQLILRFVDASFNLLQDAGGGPDTVDAGAGILGDAFNASTHPRLWRSGTAPGGTAYAEVYCIKQGTTTGQADSYAFFSKAMLCVAPAGVTKETATPWVPDAQSTLNGGAIVGGTVTDTVQSRLADGSQYFENTNAGFTPSYAYDIGFITITNNTPAMVPVTVSYSMNISWVNSGFQTAFVRMQPRIVPNTYPASNNLDFYFSDESLAKRELFAGTGTVNLDPGLTLEIGFTFYVARLAPGTCNATVYWKDANLRLEGIRK